MNTMSTNLKFNRSPNNVRENSLMPNNALVQQGKKNAELLELEVNVNESKLVDNRNLIENDTPNSNNNLLSLKQNNVQKVSSIEGSSDDNINTIDLIRNSVNNAKLPDIPEDEVLAGFKVTLDITPITIPKGANTSSSGVPAEHNTGHLDLANVTESTLYLPQGQSSIVSSFYNNISNNFDFYYNNIVYKYQVFYNNYLYQDNLNSYNNTGFEFRMHGLFENNLIWDCFYALWPTVSIVFTVCIGTYIRYCSFRGMGMPRYSLSVTLVKMFKSILKKLLSSKSLIFLGLVRKVSGYPLLNRILVPNSILASVGTFVYGSYNSYYDFSYRKYAEHVKQNKYVSIDLNSQKSTINWLTFKKRLIIGAMFYPLIVIGITSSTAVWNVLEPIIIGHYVPSIIVTYVAAGISSYIWISLGKISVLEPISGRVVFSKWEKLINRAVNYTSNFTGISKQSCISIFRGFSEAIAFSALSFATFAVSSIWFELGLQDWVTTGIWLPIYLFSGMLQMYIEIDFNLIELYGLVYSLSFTALALFTNEISDMIIQNSSMVTKIILCILTGVAIILLPMEYYRLSEVLRSNSNSLLLRILLFLLKLFLGLVYLGFLFLFFALHTYIIYLYIPFM